MKISEVLHGVRSAVGTNEKIRLLSDQDTPLLREVLRMGHDPFAPFHVVKVPRVKGSDRAPVGSDEEQWERFFSVAGKCHRRILTGNAAVSAIVEIFQGVEADTEKWMRKVLKKHMALGASTKTINKAIPGLIPTFEVQLAEKFDEKRIAPWRGIAVEPKLDGIRCLAIVRGGSVSMYARSGKPITNFLNTIGAELGELGDGCYDGEIMGEDFTELMRQAYRKDDVNVSDSYMALFDFLPLSEWDSKESILESQRRYQTLTILISQIGQARRDPFSYIRLVDRQYVNTAKEIHKVHGKYIAAGFEGAMVKDPDAPYRFGRGYEVMKLKTFSDVDLPIEAFIEGTGKHEGKLGSVIVTYNNVKVQVGSGFSDDLREKMWSDRQSFVGRVIEIRYQEVTPDGSLRFPTFKCFRNDR